MRRHLFATMFFLSSFTRLYAQPANGDSVTEGIRARRQAEAAKAATAKQPASTNLGIGVRPFQVDWDGEASCGNEMNIRVKLWVSDKDKSEYDRDPNIDGSALNLSLANSWDTMVLYCHHNFSQVKVEMSAWGELVRKGTIIEPPNKFGRRLKYVEELKTAESPNPSKQHLETDKLMYQPYLDAIFYGHFKELGDPKEGAGALYYVFTMLYGERYKSILKEPRTVTLRQEWKRKGLTVDSTTSEFLVEPAYEARLVQYLNSYPGWGGLIPSAIQNDIKTMVTRHANKNPLALRQYLDNLLRFASEQPSVQEKP